MNLVAARYPGHHELQKFTEMNLKLMETHPHMSKEVLAHPFIKQNMREAEKENSSRKSWLEADLKWNTISSITLNVLENWIKFMWKKLLFIVFFILLWSTVQLSSFEMISFLKWVQKCLNLFKLYFCWCPSFLHCIKVDWKTE